MQPVRILSLSLSLLFAACGDDPAPTKAPALSKEAAPSLTSASASATAAATSSASARSSKAVDPWTVLTSVVQTLQDKEITAAVTETLEDRGSARKVEDQRIRRAMLDVEGQLATGCSGAALDAAFATLQVRESESLTADRAALRTVLEKSTAEGRKAIWDVASPEQVFAASRKKMVDNSSANLPSWVASESNEAKEATARRTLLGLKFTIEAMSLDAATRVTELEVLVADLDPEDDATPAAVETALAQVDQALLDGQKVKFQKLVPACSSIDESFWLSMLDRGNVSAFIGVIGGTSGIASPESKTKASTSAMSGGQSGTSGGQGMQGGGQQGTGQGMQGGGQQGTGQGMQSGGQQGTGQGMQSGGQQGGGQQGGGQQGGGQQSGGQQSGGGQGTQNGGQKTGGQGMQGGTQGSQGGGQQSGGQGMQSGGQQGGGQQGSGQKTGSQGMQGGGQQGGGQKTGSQGQQGGGQQSGGQQGGGQQGGGQQGGGQR